MDEIEEKEEELKNLEEETKTESIIDKANIAAERLEKANKEKEKLLEKEEKLLAEARLQGKSLAGAGNEQVKEETPEEYANRFLKEGNLNKIF